MVSYSSWNGIRMHANHNLITNFLKNNLNFRGFVIADYAGIDQITTPSHVNYTYSIVAGISAGIDMVMVTLEYKEFIHDLFIPMSRINDAVKRILGVKFVMGLFENPLADLSMAKYLGCKEHRELAREAVRKSLVLLKNGKSTDQPLLPLQKKVSKILIAGKHADNLLDAETKGLLFKKGGLRAASEYLLAVARISVSFMLIRMLDLFSGKFG